MKKILMGLFTIIIILTFLPKNEVLASSFSDVPMSHTYYQEIMFLLDKGIIDLGKKYGVNDLVTREEVAVMVSRAIGLDSKQTSTKFKDVPSTMPSSGYINSAVNSGFINGYLDGTFKPNALVTRGHMATFISRGFKLTQEANIQFNDVAVGSTSYEHVRKLAYKNITTGYLDGSFKPNENLSRAHISVFIARAMGFEKNVKTPLDRAYDLIIQSPEFNGDANDLYYQELLNEAFEISWQIDFGSGQLTTINRWIVKDEKIVDQLWKGDVFNDFYWNNPYFPTAIVPSPQVPEFVFTSDLYLYAQDETFLGLLNTNQYDSDSIFNKYGTYGSKYSSKSIWNEYGNYGGKYSTYSPFHKYSSSPPAIVYENEIIGYLTLNEYHGNSISPIGLYEFLISLGL